MALVGAAPAPRSSTSMRLQRTAPNATSGSRQRSLSGHGHAAGVAAAAGRRSAPNACGAARRSGGKGGASVATGGHGHRITFKICGADEKSPRLIPFDDPHLLVGAPLLPELDEHPQERFCIDGPDIEPTGARTRHSVSSEVVLPFHSVVARMEAAVGQATLLLTDRLRTLQLRARGVSFSTAQVGELCELADGISAAAYHLQKWGALLAERGCHKPGKPQSNEDLEEAFASMNSSTSRILVASAAVNKGLSRVIKDSGDDKAESTVNRMGIPTQDSGDDKAESTVNRMGIPTQDIRSIAPHLECLIGRISLLSSRLRNREKLTEFVYEYFRPAFGDRISRMLVLYLEDPQQVA